MALATKDGFELTTTLERVLHQVVIEPGYGVIEIARALNVAFPTVRDNIGELKRLGFVEVLEGTRPEHFHFTRTPEPARKLVALVSTEEAWAFLQHIALRPGVDGQEEIASRLRVGDKQGVDPRTVKGYAEELEQAGVVAKVPIPRPTGRPAVGYEIRWKNIDVTLGLLLALLPPKSRASMRFAALLGMAPPLSKA